MSRYETKPLLKIHDKGSRRQVRDKKRICEDVSFSLLSRNRSLTGSLSWGVASMERRYSSLLQKERCYDLWEDSKSLTHYTSSLSLHDKKEAIRSNFTNSNFWTEKILQCSLFARWLLQRVILGRRDTHIMSSDSQEQEKSDTNISHFSSRTWFDDNHRMPWKRDTKNFSWRAIINIVLTIKTSRGVRLSLLSCIEFLWTSRVSYMKLLSQQQGSYNVCLRMSLKFIADERKEREDKERTSTKTPFQSQINGNRSELLLRESLE